MVAPKSTVTISAETDDRNVTVAVADQGPGLAEEDLDHLFVEFKTLTAKPTGREKAVGLGLAVVKKIIEMHNGTILAGNRPEGGSIFRFTLPVDAPEG